MLYPPIMSANWKTILNKVNAQTKWAMFQSYVCLLQGFHKLRSPEVWYFCLVECLAMTRQKNVPCIAQKPAVTQWNPMESGEVWLIWPAGAGSVGSTHPVKKTTWRKAQRTSSGKLPPVGSSAHRQVDKFDRTASSELGYIYIYIYIIIWI